MELKEIFPNKIKNELKGTEWMLGLEEVRVRIGQPLEFTYENEIRYWDEMQGRMVASEQQKWENSHLFRVNQMEMQEMLNYICRYSLYAYQQEIRQGYLTIEGGHRVGLAGQTVMKEGRVSGISTITFLNVRVAHEKKGCAAAILPHMRNKQSIYNTLLLSAPGVGKTTYLRDCIRILSKGETEYDGLKVGVVDERSEIAACHLGIPQNDLGPRTDVLDGCGKEAGMQMLLRSMSPQVIAVDELGTEQDFLAVEQAIYSGSRVIGTIHAGEVRELWEKPFLRNWISKKMFKRFVLLKKEESGKRTVQIYDESLVRIC